MIELSQIALDTECPACAAPLEATGWYMPGMRMLARARCTGCERAWFVDLPAGQGLYSPMILDPLDGTVHDRVGVPWFAGWLRDSYRARNAQELSLTVDKRVPLTRQVVLINCLDTLYGHALLKLLNAQQYLDAGTHDVILLVQPCLLPLIPDGIAEVWQTELPLRDGIRWSDGLAEAIAAEGARIDTLFLAPAYPHIHPSAFSIERFARIAPFAVKDWQTRPGRTVTFIWREDREWAPGNRLFRRSQASAVTSFFEQLRALAPGLDAAVAGLGAPGGLPDWIADLRRTSVDDDAERMWLRRYAASHAVVGVHGSNMLLPSALAGSAIELLPESREGNFLQDILLNGTEPRDLLFRYRFVPDDISPARLARLVGLIVLRYPDFDRLMSADCSRDRDVRT